MDLVTPPSASSVNNSPLQSSATVLNSEESIEVLGAVAEPRSENSSFIVVASSASSTPASEFSDNGEANNQITGGDVQDSPVKRTGQRECLPDDMDEEEETTVSESLAVTVMEPRLQTTNVPSVESTKEIVTAPPTSRQGLHLSLSTTTLTRPGASQQDMDVSSSSEQTLTSNMESVGLQQKATVLSLENYELQTEFSDSTHSFEEVPRGTGTSGEPATNTSSGDELETATSSDIEIISNPNGCDSSTHSRLSPNKDGNGCPTVAGVLRGHRGHSRSVNRIITVGFCLISFVFYILGNFLRRPANVVTNYRKPNDCIVESSS